MLKYDKKDLRYFVFLRKTKSDKIPTPKPPRAKGGEILSLQEFVLLSLRANAVSGNLSLQNAKNAHLTKSNQ